MIVVHGHQWNKRSYLVDDDILQRNSMATKVVTSPIQ